MAFGAIPLTGAVDNQIPEGHSSNRMHLEHRPTYSDYDQEEV